MSDAPKPVEPEANPTNPELEKLRERAQRFEAQAVDAQKKLERYSGIDPDEVAALRAANEDFQRKAALADPDKLKQWEQTTEQRIAKEYGTKLTELEQANQTLAAQLKTHQITTPVMQECVKHFNEDSASLIAERAAASCDVLEGELVVLGADGKPRINPDDPRKGYMSLEQYMRELAEQYPSCARAQTKPGTKNGTMDAPAATSSGLTFQQLAAMPDKGESVLKNMNPAEIKKLLSQA